MVGKVQLREFTYSLFFWTSCLRQHLKLSNNQCTPTEYIASVVFRETMNDITRGMTIEKSIITPDLELHRVFLDLVVFLGSTPAINSLLNETINLGNVCCHKCSTKTLCNKHYLDGRTTCFSKAHLRSVSRRLDVRNMDVPANVQRKLGMKLNPIECTRILIDLAKKIYSENDNIPLTLNNHPIVSCVLYPYAGSQIATDHVL